MYNLVNLTYTIKVISSPSINFTRLMIRANNCMYKMWKTNYKLIILAFKNFQKIIIHIVHWTWAINIDYYGFVVLCLTNLDSIRF